jgi:hypothetical protein
LAAPPEPDSAASGSDSEPLTFHALGRALREPIQAVAASSPVFNISGDGGALLYADDRARLVALIERTRLDIVVAAQHALAQGWDPGFCAPQRSLIRQT